VQPDTGGEEVLESRDSAGEAAAEEAEAGAVLAAKTLCNLLSCGLHAGVKDTGGGAAHTGGGAAPTGGGYASTGGGNGNTGRGIVEAGGTGGRGAPTGGRDIGGGARDTGGGGRRPLLEESLRRLLFRATEADVAQWRCAG